MKQQNINQNHPWEPGPAQDRAGAQSRSPTGADFVSDFVVSFNSSQHFEYLGMAHSA